MSLLLCLIMHIEPCSCYSSGASTKCHATSQFSWMQSKPLHLCLDLLSYMFLCLVLMIDGVDMLFSGRRPRCEGHAWSWHSGALHGQTLGHQTGHQCCHYSTEGWPGVYTHSRHTDHQKQSQRRKHFMWCAAFNSCTSKVLVGQYLSNGQQWRSIAQRNDLYHSLTIQANKSLFFMGFVDYKKNIEYCLILLINLQTVTMISSILLSFFAIVNWIIESNITRILIYMEGFQLAVKQSHKTCHIRSLSAVCSTYRCSTPNWWVMSLFFYLFVFLNERSSFNISLSLIRFILHTGQMTCVI